jgi:ABC-type transport system substrate-binding protein
MRKSIFLIPAILLSLGLMACGSNNNGSSVEPEENLPVITIVDTDEENQASNNVATDDSNTDNDDKETLSTVISDDQALAAIKKYCMETNPDLKDKIDSEDYTIYWNIESSDESQIVILYRSYTAAEVRYYIDRISGDTYVTEYVQGITEQEERSPETLNVKDYIE